MAEILERMDQGRGNTHCRNIHSSRNDLYTHSAPPRKKLSWDLLNPGYRQMTATRSMFQHVFLLSGFLLLSGCVTIQQEGGLKVYDLDGHAGNPLQTSSAQVVVLVFVTHDCPIANRYAPELTRIYQKYRNQGVDFQLVYADPDLSPDVIRNHLKEYFLPMPALRDPEHDLVRLAGATRTPEAAVYHRSNNGLNLVYRGRVDDRFVDFGKTRAAAVTQDLDDTIRDVLAGKEVTVPRTKAIGCYLGDFLP
jgi:thiol-disulfide isomerase/thioredoxin